LRTNRSGGTAVLARGMWIRPRVTQPRPMCAAAAGRARPERRWRVTTATAVNAPARSPMQPAQKVLPLTLNSCPLNPSQSG